MSERKEDRRIERSAGTGSVFRSGNVLGSVSYILEIWQTFHIISGLGDGLAEEVAGMQDIRIRLVRHQLDSLKLWQDGAVLTLQFEDGRRIDGSLDGDVFIVGGQMTAA